MSSPTETVSSTSRDATHDGWVAPRGQAPTVLWIMALIGVVAALVSRGIAPALPGVWVGVDHAITGLKLAAALISQFFAVASAAVIIGLVLGTVRSSLPAYLRAFAAGTGVLCILAVMIASAVRLPHASRLVLAAATGALAVMGAASAARFFTSRAPAIVIGAVASSGLVRVLTILLAGQARSDVMVVVARVTATVSWLLEITSVAVALVWLLTQPRAVPGGMQRPVRPRWWLLAVVAIAATGVGVAVVVGSAPDAKGATLLLARSVELLLANPSPYTFPWTRELVEIVRWLVVGAVMVVNPRGRMMASSVALALVATGVLEVPLCAASLVIAVLSLGLHPGPDLRLEMAPRSFDRSMSAK